MHYTDRGFSFLFFLSQKKCKQQRVRVCMCVSWRWLLRWRWINWNANHKNINSQWKQHFAPIYSIRILWRIEWWDRNQRDKNKIVNEKTRQWRRVEFHSKRTLVWMHLMLSPPENRYENKRQRQNNKVFTPLICSVSSPTVVTLQLLIKSSTRCPLTLTRFNKFSFQPLLFIITTLGAVRTSTNVDIC